jgi:O-antigen/teichoic acid export membrane protein
MKLARAKNTMRNTIWGAVYRLTTLVGPFVIKTIIIKKLGLEYSGLNSLFTAILTVLNLANLGFSSSLVYTMFKAVAEEDTEALCAMMNFYRKVYRIVGLVILGMGLAIMPFLPKLVGGECPSDLNLYILFAIYLAETSMDYLMFSYKVAIFTAYQREDIKLKINTVRYVVQYLLQIAVLLLFGNYYAYIIILPLMVFPNNLANFVVARKLYPDIRSRGELDPTIKKDIYKRVWALFGHKVGSTVLVNIDSVLISAFLGLTQSIYSNYYYILTAVNGLVEIITNGSLAGIGNKLITDTEEENYTLFRNLTYGWVTLIGLCGTMMLCLYQPFIGGVWLGSEYLLEMPLVILIVIYFYSWMFRIMQLTYRDAAGLWTKDWLKPYVGIVFNLTFSILMVKYTGSIAGVLIPTIFVMFLIYFPWEAKVLFRHLFHRSWLPYLGYMTGYTLLAAVGGCAAYGLCVWVMPGNSLMSFLVRAVVAGVVYGVIWVAITCRSREFRYVKHRIKKLVMK